MLALGDSVIDLVIRARPPVTGPTKNMPTTAVRPEFLGVFVAFIG